MSTGKLKKTKHNTCRKYTYLRLATIFKSTEQNIVSLINHMQQQFTLYKSNQQTQHDTNLKLPEALKESKSIRIPKRPTNYMKVKIQKQNYAALNNIICVHMKSLKLHGLKNLELEGQGSPSIFCGLQRRTPPVITK